MEDSEVCGQDQRNIGDTFPRFLFNFLSSSVIVSNVSACMAPSANRLGLIMTKNSRVHHERGFTMKRGAAEKAVREGNCVWMDGGMIRDANLSEMFEFMNMTDAERSERAKIDKGLPYAEIFGLRFQPTARGTGATRREGLLLWQAHDFAMSATA